MQEKAIIASTLLLCFSSNDCLPLENLLGVNRLLSSSASCLVYPEALSIVDNFEERNYLASIYFEQFLMHRILGIVLSHFFFFSKLRLAAALHHTSYLHIIALQARYSQDQISQPITTPPKTGSLLPLAPSNDLRTGRLPFDSCVRASTPQFLIPTT